MSSFEKMREGYKESAKLTFTKGDLEALERKYNSFHAEDPDKRSALDQALRDCLLEQLSSPSKRTPENIKNWEKYVTHCISACKLGLCSATMPVILLGDVFDILTLEQCEQLFSYVEQNVEIWKEAMFFSPCKNNLLRMCNDLLRRLSRSQNTVFCGRILLFLAKFFPFSERSGLNIVSEFNLENITEFGGDGQGNLKQILAEEEAEQDDDFKSDIKVTIDYNLYSKFWALQDFFRNPNQCYSKVHWKTFTSHTSNVLMAFKSFKLDDVIESKRSRLDSNVDKTSSTKMDIERQNSSSTQVYFAKFLTNQKLLELQLSDSNFRRYVLLQFLILFQYLDSQVKFKADTFELKVDQIDWVKETSESVCQLIKETPPDGPAFLKAVQHYLKREEQWNNWKNEGCKEFQKPKPPVELMEEGTSNERRRQLRPRRRGKPLGDILRDAAAQNKTFMGNSELTKLWNLCPDNLEACRVKGRDFLPSLDVYFEEAIEQSDPSAMVEDCYKKVNNGNFGWRALRLLARRSPHFFTPSNSKISKLPEYLETMIRKIAKEGPSTGTLTAPSEEIKVEVLDARTEDNGAENEGEEEELLKTIKEDPDTKKILPFTAEMVESLAVRVAPDWRKLCTKLGYEPETFIKSPQDDNVTYAREFLEYYTKNDEDASPENLAYTLEGLGMNEALAVISTAAPSDE